MCPRSGYSDQISLLYAIVLTCLIGVSACSSSNNTSPANGDSNAIPTIPGDLSSTINSSYEAELIWTDSTDDVGVVGYDIFRDCVLIQSILEANSYTDSDLSPASTYIYQVVAVDEDGNRSPAAETTLITGAIDDDGKVPSTPANIRLVYYSKSAVEIRWDPPPESEQIVATEILRDGELIGVSGSNVFFDDSREENRSYHYALIAIDVDNRRSVPAVDGFSDERQRFFVGGHDAENQLAIAKDTAVLTMPWEEHNEVGKYGSVYVFTRGNDGVWENSQKLVSELDETFVFGDDVAIDEETLVIKERQSGEHERDILHIYSRDSSGRWFGTQDLIAQGWADTINPDGTALYEYFDDVISVDGDTLYVGVGSNLDTAYVQIYLRDSMGQWNKQQKLPYENNNANSDFVFARIDGDTLIEFSMDYDYNATIHLYDRSAGEEWILQDISHIQNSNRPIFPLNSLAIEGDTILFGSNIGIQPLSSPEECRVSGTYRKR